MKRLIEYTYNSWTDSCGCCGDSSSTYCMWEDGKLVHEDYYVELCESEEDLRKVLKDLEPFEVSEDSYWF